MSNINRKPVPVRFNLKEQKDLRELCAFWSQDEQSIIKTAFRQLVIATNQIRDKLKFDMSQEDNNDQDSNNGTDGAGATGEPVPSDPTEPSTETAGAGDSAGDSEDAEFSYRG